MKKLSVAERYTLARKTAMERLNLDCPVTQADLADQLGANRLSIINIESGKTAKPREKTHKMASDFLRVNYSWLAYGDGPMDSEMPDYKPPEFQHFRSNRTPSAQAINSEMRYSYTPVIVLATGEDNKDWLCIFPDVDPTKEITTVVSPSADWQALKTEPLFQADVFFTKNETGEILTGYLLNTYLN